MERNIDIIGGGTISHIRNHLALTAPAYGTTANKLYNLCWHEYWKENKAPFHKINKYLTKMADSTSKLETNEDISMLVDQLILNKQTHIIFFNPALVDFEGSIQKDNYNGGEYPTPSGKYEERLKTSEGKKTLLLTPSAKIINKIRKNRKDIFLVAFKTTCGATEDEQFLTGLHLLKTNSCNLVLANDTKTRKNMIITPEQARYFVSTDREMVLKELVNMTLSRAEGTFTRSTVIKDAEAVSWQSDMIPKSLRTVVDYCISKGAYKPFNGSTVGHFAVKVNDNEFITSKRKVNFNNLDKVGMVRCKSESKNSVIAYGASPSVGGQSQRIIFSEHKDVDCIVHCHIPTKPNTNLSIRSQKENECGSTQCGKNTSDGLRTETDGIKCVFLDNHGPNIVFNRNIDPQKVIDFIEANFDLSKSTDQVDRQMIEVN